MSILENEVKLDEQIVEGKAKPSAYSEFSLNIDQQGGVLPTSSLDTPYLTSADLVNQVFFGDGSDGDVTISVNTTLTADKYYDDLVVNSGVTLFPNGYRIFCKTSTIINGTINVAGGNGGAGTNGADNSGANGGAGGTEGTAGTSASDNTIAGGTVGQVGGEGGIGSDNSSSGSTAGTDGGDGDIASGCLNTSPNGTAGGGGGAGGNGGVNPGGAGGVAGVGTAVTSGYKIKNAFASIYGYEFGTTVKNRGGAGSGGGGGGGGGFAGGVTQGSGGGGGG